MGMGRVLRYGGHMQPPGSPQPDRWSADGKRVVVVDTRVVALVLGVVGAVLGVVALVGGAPAVGALAGVTALGAGLSAMAGGSRTRSESSAEREQVERRDAAIEGLRAELDDTRARLARAEASVEEAAAGAPSSGGPDTHAAALTDPESGLFSEAYFRVALDSRLASARRHLRPVAVGLIEVAEGQAVDRATPAASDRVATALRETVREADIACRLDDGTYAVVLEDTPENGAVWTVERIRRNLVSRFGTHTMWAGVACYPAHAFSTDDLVEQARVALHAAQEWKQDRIEVAVAE